MLSKVMKAGLATYWHIDVSLIMDGETNPSINHLEATDRPHASEEGNLVADS
jgi:hypothetical protein